MLQIPVFDKNGKSIDTFQIDENILGGKVRKRLLRHAVLMYEANMRQGTARTRTRSEIAGSGKKMYRQKGTGRARMGDRRMPTRVGGGTMFGPQPRDFSFDINKKARREALKSAVLSKIIDKEALIIDSFGLSGIKTKEVAGTLKNLKINKSCLITVKDNDETLYKSARNLPHVTLETLRNFNAYHVLKQKHLLLTRDAAQALVESFSKDKDSGKGN